MTTNYWALARPRRIARTNNRYGGGL